MYHFKQDMYKKLMGDKNVPWLSKKLDYTPQMLYNIFNNNIDCRKVVAIAIVKTMNPDYDIDDFFEYIERN